MNKNPYSILNISEDATYEQIKDSYIHLSRNLHPDKQPIQNYHMAKQHFQTIDKAYKSIASPLRRFIFKQFGLKGISLIDQFPLEFKFYQEQALDINHHSTQTKIRHLIVYMLHEDHAMNEMDKSKLATKSILNLTKLLKKNKQPNSQKKVPDIERNSFTYQMPLPELYGFSNSFGLSNQSAGIEKVASSTLDFSFSAMKRVRNNILLNAQTCLGTQANTFDFNIDWIINNSMQIRCSPISLVNSDLQMPKIGVDKVFHDITFSGVTDFQHVNIDISDLNNQRGGSKNKLSRSFKLMIERNAVMFVPKYEYEISKDLTAIFQIMATLQEENTMNFSLNYGYRLKLSEQYKLQLLSYTGGQNFFQLSLISPKFRVIIPLISEGDMIKLELYKICALVLTYAAIKGYQYIETQNHMKRKRVIHQEYNRLSEEKNFINKAQNEVSALSDQRHDKQLKYNGLIIVKAFVGQFKKIQKIQKIVSSIPRVKQNNITQTYEALKAIFEQKLGQANIKYGEIQDELFEVTQLFRSYLKGGQIINKKMQVFHPLVDEESVPYVFALYLNRGELGIYFEDNSKIINIGGVMENKAGVIKRLKSWVIDWIW